MPGIEGAPKATSIQLISIEEALKKALCSSHKGTKLFVIEHVDSLVMYLLTLISWGLK